MSSRLLRLAFRLVILIGSLGHDDLSFLAGYSKVFSSGFVFYCYFCFGNRYLGADFNSLTERGVGDEARWRFSNFFPETRLLGFRRRDWLEFHRNPYQSLIER